MKNLILYLLFLFFCVYLMVMYEESYFFGIFWIGAGFLLLSFLLSLYLRRRVTVRLDTGSNICQHGEEFPVLVEAGSSAILPLKHLRMKLTCRNALTGESESVRAKLALPAKGHNTARIQLTASDCGPLTLTLSKIRAADPLGLFYLPAGSAEPLRISILPAHFPVQLLISSDLHRFVTDSDQYSKTRSGDDPSELFDLRNYRAGDRPQRIHWKLSARTEQVIVKDFGHPEGAPLTLFFCLSESAFKASPRRRASEMVAVLYSISLALLDENIQHYIVWTDPHDHLQRARVIDEEALLSAVMKLYLFKPYHKERDFREEYVSLFNDQDMLHFISIRPDLSVTVDEDGIFPVRRQTDPVSEWTLKLELP